MQNASIQAAGEAMPINAAGLVHNALTAMLLGSARPVKSADAPTAIEAALSAYLAEARALRRLEDAYAVTRAKLPAWANGGPQYLLQDGSKGGGDVGWPEVAVVPPPSDHRGIIRLIRPSPSDVWKHRTMTLGGRAASTRPLSPAAAARRRRERLEAFAAVRAVIARLREQREEKRKLGLPRLEAAMDASVQRLEALEDRLRALANNASPASIAVVTLFECIRGEAAFALSLLKLLAPSLSGLVRVVVDDMIASDDKAMRETMLAGGEGVE